MTTNETSAQKKARVRRETVAEAWKRNGNGWTQSTLNTALKNGEIELPPHPDFDDGITVEKLEALGFRCTYKNSKDSWECDLFGNRYHKFMYILVLFRDSDIKVYLGEEHLLPVKTMYALKQLITALGGNLRIQTNDGTIPLINS